MSVLFTLPITRALDNTGVALAGAKLWFFESGTSTPKAAYLDAALNTAAAHPVVADANGRFSALWLDTSAGAYTVKLTTSANVQVWSVDGVDDPLEASLLLATMLTVDGAGSGLNADLLDGAEGGEFAKLAEQANFTAGLQSDGIDVGYQGRPIVSETGAYELALTDAGKCVSITTGGVTIPANAAVAFPVGTTVWVFNDSASGQTIAITTDTLRLDGTATTGSRTLAQYGVAELFKVASTSWVARGAAVS